MRGTLGSLQPKDNTLLTFLHFFKARKQRKITIKITLVDTKFRIRTLEVFSAYGFFQVTWHILDRQICLLKKVQLAAGRLNCV